MPIGKRVPNFVAKELGALQERSQPVHGQALPPRRDKVLKKWDQGNLASHEQRWVLARVTLVEMILLGEPIQAAPSRGVELWRALDGCL